MNQATWLRTSGAGLFVLGMLVAICCGAKMTDVARKKLAYEKLEKKKASDREKARNEALAELVDGVEVQPDALGHVQRRPGDLRGGA